MNHLKNEKSPYLKQHVHNPVDWYPWGQEAFQKARLENKVIFLSVGYSTCHWCHVMEKESFENHEVGKVLNDYFVSIKVDREEHPDVDSIYMDVVQGMTGHGGWPMSVFLTPDLTPFFGGTYFPKDRFIYLLKQIIFQWENNPNQIKKSSNEFLEWLNKQERPPGNIKVDDSILKLFLSKAEENYDEEFGGHLGAPKFPPASEMRLLLRIYRRWGIEKPLQIVRHTLDQMAKGGIYDHLGGGFHRYSTDEKWLVPHFEKMLYDQAMLSLAYLEAFQVTQEPEYQLVLQETLNYVASEMTSPQGGFYSAEDADSEGEEGKFYVWTENELRACLSNSELEEVKTTYAGTSFGNFEGGTHIFNLQKDYYRKNRTPVLSEALKKLKSIRDNRIHPLKDEKIITSWNALMISAFAKAGFALAEPKYTQQAIKAAEFLLKNIVQSNGLILRRWIDGEAKFLAALDDYAFLIQAFIDLYECTFDEKWIFEAEKFYEVQKSLFYDELNGSYFLSQKGDESIMRRKKDFFDHVQPSGNSVTALNLLRLYGLLLNQNYYDDIVRLFSSLPKEVELYPSAFPHLLIAFDYFLDTSKEIAVLGSLNDSDVRNFVNSLSHSFLPNQVLAIGLPQDCKIPLLKNKPQLNNKPTFYICKNHTCLEPTNDVKTVLELI